MIDPRGRAWSVRRRISPRTPRDAAVFDWVDLFGDDLAEARPDAGLRLGLATAAVVTVGVVVAPRQVAQAAPLLAVLMLLGIAPLARGLFGVPTIIEAWLQDAPARRGDDEDERSAPRHIAVRARGLRAGPRAERDVCTALREGFDFR